MPFYLTSCILFLLVLPSSTVRVQVKTYVETDPKGKRGVYIFPRLMFRTAAVEIHAPKLIIREWIIQDDLHQFEY
jgi:hypothetical protein